MAIDRCEQSVEHREDLDVAVIVHSSLAIRVKVEGIDHVHVLNIGSSSFVRDVQRMLERQVPHGERLELGVACLSSACVLVVELAKADSHLSATGTRCCNNNQRAGSLDIIIFAESFIGGNLLNVVGIALNRVMEIHAYALTLEAQAVVVSRALTGIMGNHHRRNEESALDERLAQAQDVLIVGNAQVLAHLVALDVVSRKDDHDLQQVAQLRKHAQFAIRQESGQHTAGVQIVEELAA